MIKVEGLTIDPYQRQEIPIEGLDQSLFLTFYYRPLQRGWYIESLVYGDFVLNMMRLSVNPNLLYQWRKILPFGLACFSQQNREPTIIDDFATDQAELYLLSLAEVLDVVAYYAE